MSTTENPTLQPIATTTVRIFGAISFFILATVNFSLNILLILTLYRGRKSFIRNAFYSITWQLCICDAIANTLEFLVPIPLTLAGYDMYGKTLFLYIPCFFETLSYNATLYFSFLMTINRITVFVSPRLNRYFFQDHISLVIGLLWLFLFAIVIIWNVIGCYKSFSSNGFYYYFIHTEPEDSIPGYYVANFFYIGSTYYPISMFIIYIIMIFSIQLMLRFDFTNWRIRSMGILPTEENSAQKLKREFSLLAQAFVICAVLEINNLVFNSLPQIKAKGQITFLVTFVGRWTGLTLTGINAYVLFFFNKDIRRRLREVLTNPWGVTTTAVTSIQNNSSQHQ